MHAWLHTTHHLTSFSWMCKSIVIVIDFRLQYEFLPSIFCWAYSIKHYVCDFTVNSNVISPYFLRYIYHKWLLLHQKWLIHFCRLSNNFPRNSLHLFESLTIIRSEFAFGCTVCFNYIDRYFSQRNFLVHTINLFSGTPSTFVQAVFLQTVAVYMCHLLFESLFSKKKKIHIFRSKSNDFLMHIFLLFLQ